MSLTIIVIENHNEISFNKKIQYIHNQNMRRTTSIRFVIEHKFNEAIKPL